MRKMKLHVPSFTYWCSILRQQGVAMFVSGGVRSLYYARLRKRYNFDPWHITAYELRPYATDIVKYLRKICNGQERIVEIGCGLGDLIRNMKGKRYAFDISSNAIDCAKYLDVDKAVEWHVGSFSDVKYNISGSIDYLITVNFIHVFDSESLKNMYNEIIEGSSVKNIIVDVVPREGAVEHDFGYILSNYKIAREIGSYNGRRVIHLTRTNGFNKQ